MRAAYLSILLALISPVLSAWAAEVPKADQLRVTQQVHDIFQAKCVDCHGATLPKPKGKFGYVLDLARVADNPDYVIRGNPEKSEIYKMVEKNEMPGEDAKVEPLTKSELAVVQQWIEMGAPGELPPTFGAASVVAAAGSKAATSAAAHKPPEPLWRGALRWIGKFHPVSTHFPVALMFAAVLAEAFGWATRRESWLQTVRFLVIIAALGAMSATVLGWVNAYFSSYDKAPGALLWWHRWLGTGTAIWAIVCASTALMGECKDGSAERRRFRGALLVGAVLVGVSGFLGSALIYGLDHYAWN